MTTAREDQLWLWLEDCEAQKPVVSECSLPRDKVVRVLQYGVREGDEARRAGVVDQGPSSNLQ